MASDTKAFERLIRDSTLSDREKVYAIGMCRNDSLFRACLQSHDWQAFVKRSMAEEEKKLNESVTKLAEAILIGQKRQTVKQQLLAGKRV